MPSFARPSNDADARRVRVLRTADLAEAEARASELFGPIRVVPLGAPPAGPATLRSLRLGRVLLVDVAYGVAAEIDSPMPKTGFVAQTVLDGLLHEGDGPGAVEHRAGSTLVYVPGDPLRMRVDAASSRFCVVVDPTLLPGLRPAAPIDAAIARADLVDARRPSGTAAARWHHLVAYLRAEMDLRTRGATASPFADDRAIEEWILTRLLDCCLDPMPAGDGVAPAGWLPRAIAFVDAHAGRPIGAVEIGRHCGVTPRAVHAAFRDHLGTTPLRFVERRRRAQPPNPPLLH